MSYRATSTTTGRPAMDRVNYVYNGSKPLKGEPRSAPGPGGDVNASRRRDRLEQFAVILAGLSAGDLEHAPIAAIREAGAAVGVGEKTARAYRAELGRQERAS
jgi:hypothetical protein